MPKKKPNKIGKIRKSLVTTDGIVLLAIVDVSCKLSAQTLQKWAEGNGLIPPTGGGGISRAMIRMSRDGIISWKQGDPYDTATITAKGRSTLVGWVYEARSFAAIFNDVPEHFWRSTVEQS